MRKKQPLTVETAKRMVLDGLGEDELNALQTEAERLYDLLLQQEPEDTESEEYADWEEKLEVLDDLMDDIQDRL